MAGRISYRDSVRTPDVVGGSSLNNVSPFEDWTVKLYGASSEGLSVDDVEDVVLELHLGIRMMHRDTHSQS